MFMVEGRLGKHDLSRGRGLSIDLYQRKYLHPPVGCKSHLFQQVHVKGHLTRKLVVKSQQEINQTQHLFFSTLGELPVERKEKRIKEKAFDSTVQGPFLEAGVVGL